MKAALEAVLLFHSASPWDDAKREQWKALTGSEEATTKVLCDTVRTGLKALEPLPKIFVFCNGCAPEWHRAFALAEDGTGLAGHVCSSHGFIQHDMGFNSSWKRDIYEKHYPGGYELVWVPDAQPGKHAGLDAAAALASKKNEEAT